MGKISSALRVYAPCSDLLPRVARRFRRNTHDEFLDDGAVHGDLLDRLFPLALSCEAVQKGFQKVIPSPFCYLFTGRTNHETTITSSDLSDNGFDGLPVLRQYRLFCFCRGYGP